MDISIAERLASLCKLFASQDTDGLKEFAHVCAEDALALNDQQIAEFSIVAFALAKLFDKPHIVHSSRWKKFSQQLVQRLTQGEKCTGSTCSGIIDAILNDIDDLSSDLGGFVVSVVEKARLKTAAQLYSHGASIGIAVELTNADRRELLSYLGAMTLADRFESKKVSQRIALTDKLFT